MVTKGNGKRTLPDDWPMLLAMSIDLLVVLAVWSRLPNPIPIHWNGGAPDSFAPRWAGALLPIPAAGLLYVYLKANAATRLKGYPPGLTRLYALGVPLLLLIAHVGTLISAM